MRGLPTSSSTLALDTEGLKLQLLKSTSRSNLKALVDFVSEEAFKEL